MKPIWFDSEMRAVEKWKEYGSKPVPCSGAMQTEKLDVVVEDLGYRISNKLTVQKSASIPLKDWFKDEQQAMFMGDKVFRRIEFVDPVTNRVVKTLIVIEEDRLLELLTNG